MKQKKVYLSSFTSRQFFDYNALEQRGVLVTPFEYKNLIKDIKTANKIIKARSKDVLVKEAKFTTNLSLVIRTTQDILGLKKKLGRIFETRNMSAAELNSSLRANLVHNVELLFGDSLNLEMLTDEELKRFLSDPLYKKFNNLLYAYYTDEESINNSKIGKSIKNILYLAGREIDVIISDIGGHAKNK